MTSVLKQLDDFIADAGNSRDARQLATVTRTLLLVMLSEGPDIGRAEVLQETIGDLYSPEPDGVLKARADRGIKFELTGEYHDDGAPVRDRNRPVRVPPDPPPPPRERGGTP